MTFLKNTESWPVQWINEKLHSKNNYTMQASNEREPKRKQKMRRQERKPTGREQERKPTREQEQHKPQAQAAQLLLMEENQQTDRTARGVSDERTQCLARAARPCPFSLGIGARAPRRTASAPKAAFARASESTRGASARRSDPLFSPKGLHVQWYVPLTLNV
jgi:hypothetical protein